jgi:hypothetical protein
VRMYGWWYMCIGVGFALLGLRSAVRGDSSWSLVLRFVLGAGFCALGISTLRSRRQRQGRSDG